VQTCVNKTNVRVGKCKRQDQIFFIISFLRIIKINQWNLYLVGVYYNVILRALKYSISEKFHNSKIYLYINKIH